MKKIIFIKYGELTTKKGNRNAFIKKLISNIKKMLNNDYKIKADRSRLYIETEDIDYVVDKLKFVFGIHSIVVAYQVDNNIDTINNIVSIDCHFHFL